MVKNKAVVFILAITCKYRFTVDPLNNAGVGAPTTASLEIDTQLLTLPKLHSLLLARSLSNNITVSIYLMCYMYDTPYS